MDFDDKLAELFIDLPEPPTESGNSVWAVQTGKLLYVGGCLPFSEGRIQHPGRVGVELKVDTAKLAARIAAIQILAAANRALGGTLNKIRRIVRIDGDIACSAEFRDHGKVIEGAGELFAQIFGAYAKHIRHAVGVMSLPQNACVQLTVLFEVK